MTSALTAYTGVFAGHNVTMLEKLILWELGQVSGTTASFSRFPKWLIRQKLTERQNQFVSVSKCLRKFALIVAKADRRQYRLPANCMENGVVAARYYSDSSTYEDLDLLDTRQMDEKYRGWRTSDSSTPQVVYSGESYGGIQVLGAYPPPENTGDNYADSPGTGFGIGTKLPAISTNYTGTATGGGATTLTDTGTTFTDLGLVAGMWVRNVTDNASGKISTVATNTITHSTLTGGTANVFASSDSYIILAGEYAVICEPGREDRFIFGNEIGAVSGISVPDDNFLIEYVPYPLPFSWSASEADADQDADSQYPDIPRIYHKALADGVIADLLGSFHENSKEFKRAGAYEQKFQAAMAQAKEDKSSRPWDRSSQETRVFVRRRR